MVHRLLIRRRRLLHMSTLLKDQAMMVPFQGASMPAKLGPMTDEYVEIGLLLPKNRAAALLELARDRHETIGQILRKMVDRALTDNVLD